MIKFSDYLTEKINYEIKKTNDSFDIVVDNKIVGHLDGVNINGVLDVKTLEIDKKFRGTGLIQSALQDIANMYKGLQSNGNFRSEAATKMYKKIKGIISKDETTTLGNGNKHTVTHFLLKAK